MLKCHSVKYKVILLLLYSFKIWKQKDFSIGLRESSTTCLPCNKGNRLRKQGGFRSLALSFLLNTTYTELFVNVIVFSVLSSMLPGTSIRWKGRETLGAYSLKCGPWTTGTRGIIWELGRNRILSFTPDVENQSVHFNKISGDHIHVKVW